MKHYDLTSVSHRKIKMKFPFNVNQTDTAGRRSTALHFASGYGRKDIVEFLLSNGANIHSKDDGGLYPLHK